MEVSDSSISNVPMLPNPPGQILPKEQLASVSGDGAYDTKNCSEAVALHEAEVINPIRKNAKPWKMNSTGAAVRNKILRATRRSGRTTGRKWSGYHRCGLVETKVRCFKLLGKRIMARDCNPQVAEFQVRAAELNRVTLVGTSVTVAMP